MSTFGNVFNTTWKVVLSLALIVAIVGVVYAVLTYRERSDEKQVQARFEALKKRLREVARPDPSLYHTKVPKSVWDKRVAWAAKHHCTFVGMSRDEIVQALGPPSKESKYGLDYIRETNDCARYNGDTCVERKKIEKPILLENGYGASINYVDQDCHTVSGDHEWLGLPVPKFGYESATAQ